MLAFRTLTAIALPLLRDNVDTDAIIPSREIRHICKQGLGEGLFAGWRYRSAGSRTPNPAFVLNDAAYRGAALLLSGANFGCGSSREQAVWALAEYGFRAIVAPSFAPIFFDNCINNGLLPAILPAQHVQALAGRVAREPRAAPVTIDLKRCQIGVPGLPPFAFSITADARTRLLDGLDPIELTLRSRAAIDAFRARDRESRPWVYLEPGP